MPCEHHSEHHGHHGGESAHPCGGCGGHCSERRLTDAELRQIVNARLQADPRIPAGSQIDVQAQNGVVTLTGSVTDSRVRHAAADLVLGVPGVADLQNNLRVCA